MKPVTLILLYLGILIGTQLPKVEVDDITYKVKYDYHITTKYSHKRSNSTKYHWYYPPKLYPRVSQLSALCKLGSNYLSATATNSSS